MKASLPIIQSNLICITCIIFPPGFSQTSQPMGVYSKTYINPRVVVPGMGVSWQHSVPNNMPWTDQVYGTVNSGVTTFSGKPMVSQSYVTV